MGTSPPRIHGHHSVSAPERRPAKADLMETPSKTTTPWNPPKLASMRVTG